MSSKEATRTEAPLEPPAKEVVRLPDGRELTYYRFPVTAPQRPAPASPAAGKER